MAHASFKHIPISELRRRFGEIEKDLPYLDHILLTKKGKPLARLTAAPEIKRALRQKTAGAWRHGALDQDALWRDVMRRTSRRRPIKL